MGTLFPTNFILHWKQLAETRGAGETRLLDPVARGGCAREDAEGVYEDGCWGGYQDISLWIDGWRVIPAI